MKHLFISIIICCSFFSCKTYIHQVETNPSKYDLNTTAETKGDSTIDAMIEPYKKQLDAKMNEVIGVSEIEMTKALPECTLGNWASDAIYEQSILVSGVDVDFAVVNYGGIRIPALSKGNVSRGKIFELMPFDNLLVVLKVKGDIVQQLFDSMAARGGWPVSNQVKCSFNKEGVIQSLTISDKPIDKNKIYHIALSDYIANGGDQCSFFKGLPQVETGLLFRDAFLNHINVLTKSGKNLNAKIEGRMSIQ